MVKSWEQLPNEPNTWFARFTAYRLLGVGRSIRKAFRNDKNRPKTTNGNCNHWLKKSNEFDWNNRCYEWDKVQLNNYEGRVNLLNEQLFLEAKELQIQNIKEAQETLYGLSITNKTTNEELEKSAEYLQSKTAFNYNRNINIVASAQRNISATAKDVIDKITPKNLETAINPFFETYFNLFDTFRDKQRQTQNSYKNAFALITTGAVRSSKTYAVNLIALKYLHDCEHDVHVVISGNTSGTAAANVVSQWRQWLVGAEFKNVSENKDQFMRIEYGNLSRHKFYVVGGGKENDQDKVQGKTIGLWIADELSKHAKSFTDMMLSRLSLPYSKMMATMNPLGSYHYTTTEFLNNKEKIDSGQYKVIHFVLDDNPSLSQDVKDRLHGQYPKNSVFYKRNILGVPAIAEGAIYEMFGKENKIKASDLPEVYHEMVIAVDYGTTNPCVWCQSGKSEDKLYLSNEYYYDSRSVGVQKTDSQYADDMVSYFEKWNIPESTSIVVDPSAASFIAELRKQRFIVIAADNSVLDGIKRAQDLIYNKKLFIADDCPNGLREIDSYVWDDKAAQKGEDKPIKQHDHFVDMMRYAVNHFHKGQLTAGARP